MPDKTERVRVRTQRYFPILIVRSLLPQRSKVSRDGPFRRCGDMTSHGGKSAWGVGLSYSRGPFVETAGSIGSTVFVGIGLKF